MNNTGKMKTTCKSIVCLLFLLVLCLMTLPSITAQAAKKKKTTTTEAGYMKNMKGLKWDLKKGKKFKTKLRIAGIGLRPYTVEMTKYKLTKENSSGFRTLTYTLRFTPKWKPTKAQVHKIVNSDWAVDEDEYEGYCYNLQPDYYTGYDLEFWDSSPVVINLGNWIESEKKYYFGTKSGEWYYTNVLTQTTTISFPASYKGLCIVIGTSHIMSSTAEDEAYLDGDLVFGATSFYRFSRSSFHAMRVM